MVGVLMFALIVPTVMAKDESAKKSLVALGDSITYGYDLENNLNHVSKKAYPQLLGEELNYRVRNLAVSGWTSQDLLIALKTDDKYRDAIKNADLITLNIGGNDVLGYLKTVDFNDPEQLLQVMAELQTRLQSYYINIGLILSEIRSMNQEAPILHFGFYNPVGSDHPLNLVILDLNIPDIPDLNSFIAFINHAIFNLNPETGMVEGGYSSIFNELYYVDALRAFESYVVLTDGSKSDLLIDPVHPSELGHQLLYEAAKTVFEMELVQTN